MNLDCKLGRLSAFAGASPLLYMYMDYICSAKLVGFTIFQIENIQFDESKNMGMSG